MVSEHVYETVTTQIMVALNREDAHQVARGVWH